MPYLSNCSLTTIPKCLNSSCEIPRRPWSLVGLNSFYCIGNFHSMPLFCYYPFQASTTTSYMNRLEAKKKKFSASFQFSQMSSVDASFPKFYILLFHFKSILATLYFSYLFMFSTFFSSSKWHALNYRKICTTIINCNFSPLYFAPPKWDAFTTVSERKRLLCT